VTLRAIAPSPTLLQLSGETAAGEPILSVVVKRTYRVGPKGALDPDTEQIPLCAAEIDPQRQNLLVRDADVYPLKPLTDIVVAGHAYAPGKRGSFTAELRAGAVHKSLLVTGERRVTLSGGRAVFSDPAPADKVPLSCDQAYGGRDAFAEKRHGVPWSALQPYLPENMDVRAHSPYLYSRNPSGRGYVIEPVSDSVEDLLLPSLEDPTDPLTPDRLFVGSPLAWPDMPLPWYLGWQSHAAFPRIGYTGAIRPFQRPSREGGQFPEVTRGLAPAGFPKIGPAREVFDDRFWNGASLGLATGPLGPEIDKVAFSLVSLHPTLREWGFSLPKSTPRIQVDGRKGALLDTTPVIATILIEPDHDRVSVVWRGTAPAKRRYALEELLGMPLLVDWP